MSFWKGIATTAGQLLIGCGLVAAGTGSTQAVASPLLERNGATAPSLVGADTAEIVPAGGFTTNQEFLPEGISERCAIAMPPGITCVMPI